MPKVSMRRSGVSTSAPPRLQRHDAPSEQEDLVVLDGLTDVVRRRHERRAAAELGGEGVQVALPTPGVETRGRLIEHDEVGPAREHLRQVDALPLASGELAQGSPAQGGHIHRLERPVHELAVERSGRPKSPSEG